MPKPNLWKYAYSGGVKTDKTANRYTPWSTGLSRFLGSVKILTNAGAQRAGGSRGYCNTLSDQCPFFYELTVRLTLTRSLDEARRSGGSSDPDSGHGWDPTFLGRPVVVEELAPLSLL